METDNGRVVPGEGGAAQGLSATVKRQPEGDLCGDPMFWVLISTAAAGISTQAIKPPRTLHTLTPVLISGRCYFFHHVRHRHWGKPAKGSPDLSTLPSELSVTLWFFQNKKCFFS